MGCVLDGLLVRDLQVAPDSRHAHFLQPLPAKCGMLSRYSTRFRRRLLRLGEIPKAQKRCVLLSSDVSRSRMPLLRLPLLPAKCGMLSRHSTRFRRRLLRLGEIPRPRSGTI